MWSISGLIKNLQPVGLKMDGKDYLLTQWTNRYHLLFLFPDLGVSLTVRSKQDQLLTVYTVT